MEIFTGPINLDLENELIGKSIQKDDINGVARGIFKETNLSIDMVKEISLFNLQTANPKVEKGSLEYNVFKAINYEIEKYKGIKFWQDRTYSDEVCSDSKCGSCEKCVSIDKFLDSLKACN